MDDKTQTYSDDNKTSVYNDQEKRTKPSVHNLHSGDKIVLNGKNYEILEIISESTGEAIIYKMKNDADKIEALKLYFEFHNPENEPNTEALERIKKINDEDILRLYDFGTGINKYQDKYCFEIADFAEGYDLLTVNSLNEKYNKDFVEKKVIPQIFYGIQKLHKTKIYHCDLKPQNVFYLDKEQTEIVIGDYGSAKTFEFNAEKSSRKTTTVKGTDFYLPPEQARGFISDKNDYYSFGMILLHLCYPEQLLSNDQSTVNHLKFKEIIERQFEGKPIINFKPEFSRINQLIEGLTLVDFNLRWGADQVREWIEGKNVEINYQKKEKSSYILKFGQHTITTPADLRDYILSDANWYHDLIEDTDNKDEFFNWVLNYYDGDRTKRSAINRIIKTYSPDGIYFVADAIIRFFIPEHPVMFGLKSFDFAGADDLRRITAEAFAYLLFDLWNNSSEKDIRLCIFRYEFALKQLVDKHTNIKYLLTILYKQLNIKEKVKRDFSDYAVHAFTKISKKSSESLRLFLFSYLPTKNNIVFNSFDDQNFLYYTIEKSLTDYYSEIGLNQTFKFDFEENIPIVHSEIYDSLDNFIEKTIENVIINICNKDEINRDAFSEQEILHLKKELQNSHKNLLTELTSKRNSFKKEFPRNIEQFDYVKRNLKVIDSVIRKKSYHQIKHTLTLLKNVSNYAREQVIEQQKKKAKVPKKKVSWGVLLWIFILLVIIVGPFLISPITELVENIQTKKRNKIRSHFKYNPIIAYHSNLELVFVKGGTFELGSDERSSAKPEHEVTVDSFYLGRYEITNDEFCSFLNEYGTDYVKEGKYKGKEMVPHDRYNNISMDEIEKKRNTWRVKDGHRKYPVVHVNWYGAYEFCRFYGGSLPTEAQWEFAAKGGIHTQYYKYPGSDSIDYVAWTTSNSKSSYMRPGGLLLHNELGLYDMMGNVAEWTKDTYSEYFYATSPKVNPLNDSIGDLKVVRGGSKSSYAGRTQIEDRKDKNANEYDHDIGFRFCYSGKPNGIGKPEKSISSNTKPTEIIENEMIFVEGGTYAIGQKNPSLITDKIFPVTLSSFYISKYEITNAQYCEFLNARGSNICDYQDMAMVKQSDQYYNQDWGIHYKEGNWVPVEGYENYPIIFVNWFGASEYCKWAGGRLPTEAEWEYAARGGNKSKSYEYSGSNSLSQVGWYYSNSGKKTHRVGLKQPNELGIYDMSGNVREWCEDEFDSRFFDKITEDNPCNRGLDYKKSVRGGSFDYLQHRMVVYKRRNYYNNTGYNSYEYNDVGFRMVKDAKQSEK